MKKTILAFFVLSAALQANAQFNRKLIFVGVRGGANFSQLQTEGLSISRPGASIQDFLKITPPIAQDT